TLQEDDHVIGTTKPVDNSNKLRVERCRAAGELGKSVFDEPTGYFSVLVRIARLQDQILELKENPDHQQRRRNCDSGDDRSIFGVLARATNVYGTHDGKMFRSLLRPQARPEARVGDGLGPDAWLNCPRNIFSKSH